MSKFRCILLFLLNIFHLIGGTWLNGPNVCAPVASGYYRKHCPDDWVRFRQEKCFKLFRTTKQTWVGAQDICKQYNSNLASVHSKEELQFLTAYSLTECAGDTLSGTWIGAFKRGSIWTWVDFSPFDWADWFPAYPQDQPPCVYLQTDAVNDPSVFGRMVNWQSCNHSLNFICQKYVLDASTIVYSP